MRAAGPLIEPAPVAAAFALQDLWLATRGGDISVSRIPFRGVYWGVPLPRVERNWRGAWAFETKGSRARTARGGRLHRGGDESIVKVELKHRIEINTTRAAKPDDGTYEGSGGGGATRRCAANRSSKARGAGVSESVVIKGKARRIKM